MHTEFVNSRYYPPMLPDWLTKPEVIFAIVLALLISPLWTSLTRWIWRHLVSWHASRSEFAARKNIEYLQRKFEHPPTLVESLAFIICFLPLPFALAMAALTVYVLPPPPSWFPTLADDPHMGQGVVRTFLVLVCLSSYALFGTLTVHGIQIAFRLRHGATHYADNYRAGIEKRINKLKKKFPQLIDV